MLKQSRDHENENKAKISGLTISLPELPENGMSNQSDDVKSKVESLKNASVLLDTKLRVTLDRALDLQERKYSISEVDVPEQILTITPVTEAKDGSTKRNKHHILNPSASKYNTNENNDLCTANNDLRLLTEYGELATILMDLLTSSFCYVCPAEISKANHQKLRGNHYNCDRHYQMLNKRINIIVKNSGFCIIDIDDLICFACHAIFPKKRYAEIHYGSSGHLSKIRKFCNVCLQRLGNREAVDHYNEPQHKTLETTRKMEKEKKLKISMPDNQPINPTFNEASIPKIRSISNLEIHGINVNVIKALIQDKLDETVQCDPITKSLIELMTPTYCFICNKSALRNNRGTFKHYTYQTHQKELKQFLRNKEKSGAINYESVFCEACNKVFLNNELAAEHYNTAEHKEICAPFGTERSNIHKSALQSINDPIGIMIAEKLKDLVSPTFCFICQTYVNVHLPNQHYLESDHTIKLRSWLDIEIGKSGIQIDRNVLYCEDCSLELGGTHDDLKHYETDSHQLNKQQYCSTCMFRGTPSEVCEHMSSKQHKDRSIDNSQENKQDSLWPEKLTNLMTFNECKVCCEKLLTTAKADFHYCSQSHSTKVKQWIERYKQLNYKTYKSADAGFKKFWCAPCEYSFASKQELNDHKYWHMSTWRGPNGELFWCAPCEYSFASKQELNDHKYWHMFTWRGPNGYDSSSKTSTSNNGKETSKPQKKRPKEVTIDKPISLTQSAPDSEIELVSMAQELQEKNSSNNVEYSKHYEEISIEMKKLINTVYFLKPLPLEQSIGLLKDLNDKLTAYTIATNEVGPTIRIVEKPCKDNEPTNEADNENIVETKQIIMTSPSTSNEDEIMDLQFLPVLPHRISHVTEGEYAKTKLSMEICRLKTVINNKSKIPLKLAFKYVQNLQQLLDDLVNGDSKEFEIESIFERSKNTFISLENVKQDTIQDELDKLSTTLLDVKKISVELALDVITQFNMQLENFLQYQDDDSSLYFYLPDS